MLTLNVGTPQGGNDLTDNPRFTSWSLWKRRKAETAAKNGSKEYRTAFPLGRHEACRPAIGQTGHQVSVSGHYRPREIQNSFYSIEISSFNSNIQASSVVIIFVDCCLASACAASVQPQPLLDSLSPIAPCCQKASPSPSVRNQATLTGRATGTSTVKFL